ncbi:MAG: hypothetical protein ACKOA8_14610 [Deltaproteobacteria bacterium]
MFPLRKGLLSWARAFIPLSLPIFCTALIHHFFFRTFGENNLTLGIYSRDIYIPLGLGAIFSLSRMLGYGVSLQFRPFFGALTLGLGVLIVVLLHHYWSLASQFSHSFLVVTLLASCVLLLISAFLTTLKFFEILAYIRKENTAALYVLIALASLLNYPMILNFFWKQASFLTAKSVYYVYLLFGVPLHFQLTPVSFNLSGGGFAIKIIMGCSGLEGIFFFIFGFSLIQCLEKKSFDWKVPLAYFVGSVFLFLLNTLRITSFYFLGIQLKRVMASSDVRKVIEAAFHNHFGWILYLVGIIIFMRIYRALEQRLSLEKSLY